eukprot:TRINITY_DN5225_c0_g1_i1.p2 TRINITY_DN5225_c0_g1~~TRINITY_DN5225_c0_g1_i1.p2  ORF type:complete len:219 (+),score=52.14 TRINITY_DN5225_c0_g1_i1:94-657(+)
MCIRDRYKDFDTFRTQINDYRNERRTQTINDLRFSNGKNIITMAEIEKKRIAEDVVRFGKEALKYTNEFRKKQGLREVEWNQELCDIGMVHSKNMADRKVPFGHQGFNDRFRQVKFGKKSMCENVAYMNGYSDVAKVAVDGWINSPGHRKNLLSDSNVCGIACYRREDGTWYLTQLLAYRYQGKNRD